METQTVSFTEIRNQFYVYWNRFLFSCGRFLSLSLNLGILWTGSFAVLGCNSFTPASLQSSMVIVGLTLHKDDLLFNELIAPYFDEVYIQNATEKFSHSESTANFYYFPNVPVGSVVELKKAIHNLNRGGLSSGTGVSAKSLNELRVVFDESIRSISRTTVQPGTIHFIGEFDVKVQFRFREDPEIKVDGSRSVDGEMRALQFLSKNFPRSGWGELARIQIKRMERGPVQSSVR